MLPRVNTENRAELANDRVLVLVRLDADVARLDVLDQPCPATALDAREGSVELLLEPVEAAVAVVDGLGEGTRRRLTAALRLGCQVLPEEGVVDVTAWTVVPSVMGHSIGEERCFLTSVEVDERLQGNLSGDIILGLGLGNLLREVVVRGHVGVVVVLVVELHDLAGHGRLERAVVICGSDVGQRDARGGDWE